MTTPALLDYPVQSSSVDTESDHHYNIIHHNFQAAPQKSSTTLVSAKTEAKRSWICRDFIVKKPQPSVQSLLES